MSTAPALWARGLFHASGPIGRRRPPSQNPLSAGSWGPLACPGDDTLPLSTLSLLITAIAVLLRSVVWLVLILRARRADLPAIARALGSVRALTVSVGRHRGEDPTVSDD